MIAHQWKIRERRRAMNLDADLFGNWWEGIDVSIDRAVIRECSLATAKDIIEKYEWLGCLGLVFYAFGIYWDGHCGGVVCYRTEYSENLGTTARSQDGPRGADWSRYGYEGKMLLLSRGACVHWAHPHAASKLIRRSMDLLPRQYEVITATTDPAAGEIGTIYQACGFDYVGSMRESVYNTQTMIGRRAWMIDGKIVGSRHLRTMCGTAKAQDITRMFPDAVPINQHNKHRYFAFRGSRAVQKRHRRAIQHLIKPYPKRDRAQEGASDDQSQGVGQFDGHAPTDGQVNCA